MGENYFCTKIVLNVILMFEGLIIAVTSLYVTDIWLLL